MVWARMLAYITGTVDQELLLRNEYLAAERDRCAEPCSNTWPITTRSAITRASRTRKVKKLDRFEKARLAACDTNPA